MDPDGKGGCKQHCPVCECNIVEEDGTLTCSKEPFKQIDLWAPFPYDCVGKFGTSFPSDHTNSDGGRYCCPAYHPTELKGKVVCEENKY
jgi:hypothetical protein